MAENLLLAVLPEEERRRIAPFCQDVALDARSTLFRADSPIDCAWFPHSGVCSSLVHVASGEAVEVGMVGREGMLGIPLVLGASVAAWDVVVQIAGTATRIRRQDFLTHVLVREYPLCGALMKYANLFLSIVAQTAACNRLHRIDQRLARWLLDICVRVENDTLPLTHELLGLMVGAYRPSVTNALGELEAKGVVRVSRGAVTIVDARGLALEACDCHALIEARTRTAMERIRSAAA
jgi:CRP-like cAMP-binding protein